MLTTITKHDLLIAYDAINWFFRHRPDNPEFRKRVFSGETLIIPFFTKDMNIQDILLFSDRQSGVNGFTAVVDEDTFLLAFDASDSPRDWKTNLSYRHKIMPYDSCKASPVRIHRGYATGWLRVRDTIHARFRDSKLRKVLVCGYSMGGALSPIGALDLQYNFNISADDIKCISGDAPRVFNRAGNISFNSRVPNTIRLKWGNDLIPKCPPPCFGFWHVGKLLHFGPKERWWKMSLLDHDPGRGAYCTMMYLLEDGVVDPSLLKIKR